MCDNIYVLPSSKKYAKKERERGKDVQEPTPAPFVFFSLSNLALRNSRQSSWSLSNEVYEEGQEIKKGNGYTGYGLKKNGN